jgi:hypothetical protein
LEQQLGFTWRSGHFDRFSKRLFQNQPDFGTTSIYKMGKRRITELYVFRHHSEDFMRKLVFGGMIFLFLSMLFTTCTSSPSDLVGDAVYGTWVRQADGLTLIFSGNMVFARDPSETFIDIAELSLFENSPHGSIRVYRSTNGNMLLAMQQIFAGYTLKDGNLTIRGKSVFAGLYERQSE